MSVIKFILKYLQDIWLDEDLFPILSTSVKINNVPAIVWNSILHLDILIIEEFPDCDKTFIKSMLFFYLMSLTSYLNMTPSIDDILLFSTTFLTNSFDMQTKLAEYTR